MKRYLPLLAILALLGAFAAQGATATAASPAHPNPPFAHVDLRHPFEVEEEDEEFGADEGEIDAEECEAGFEELEFEFESEEEAEEAEEELEEACEELTKKKDSKGSPFVTAPAACQVSRVESTITTMPASDEVRLSLRYKTYAPTPVSLSLRLRDQKGSVAIEHATEHLGAHGVVHLTTDLSSAMMERALAASEFDVSLRAPGSPAVCAGDLEQRLYSSKHTSAKAPRVYSG